MNDVGEGENLWALTLGDPGGGEGEELRALPR